MRRLLTLSILVSLAACAPFRLSSPPAVVPVPAGSFIMGSDAAEREAAYRMDEAAYGHAETRKNGWYSRELPRQEITTDAYNIMQRPVTNELYASFIVATGWPAPYVDRVTWDSFGLAHSYDMAERYMWGDGEPPPGRSDHPVVLVNHADAEAFAAWLSTETGFDWRLPTEAEWEKAARGTDGRYFPWGDEFDPWKLNSHDNGPFDTIPAGIIPSSASPFGMKDAAGQVYEWTATPSGEGYFIVKGGAWDDKGCGVCRPAARHSRHGTLKHVLIGFRLVRDADPE